MLALERQFGDRTFLYLPDGSKITIVANGSRRSGSVKLCIDAPMSVRIERAEIVDPVEHEAQRRRRLERAELLDKLRNPTRSDR